MPNIDNEHSTMDAHKFLASLSQQEAFKAMQAYQRDAANTTPERDKLQSFADDCESVDLGHVAEYLRELAAAQPQPGEAERLLRIYEGNYDLSNNAEAELNNIRTAIRALEAENAQLRSQLATAMGALSAQHKMQNEQLNQWRERLQIPDSIVASSDVVDDICEVFYTQIATARNDALEEARMHINKLYGNIDNKVYNQGLFDAMQSLWVLQDRAMKEVRNG